MIIHVINEHDVIKLIVMYMSCNYNKFSTTYGIKISNVSNYLIQHLQ
jgi:hypothetical protein